MKEETRLKISLSHKGKVLSDEHKAKIGLANKGRSPSNKGKSQDREQIEKRRLALTGQKRTDEFCKKQSEARKGKSNSPSTQFRHGDHMGTAHPRWKGGLPKCVECGKPLSSYVAKKCSKCAIADRIGEKSVSWKGGVTPCHVKIRTSIELVLWRNSIFARDNFTCQKCNIKGGRLQAHHIKNFASFPELRTAIDNGTTLCVCCHKDFHKKYGKKNNNAEQLTVWE